MKFLSVLSLILIMGCASSPRQETKEDMINALKQDTYMLDEEEKLPSWVNEAGLKDGFLVAVGAAEGNAEQSPIYLRRAAMMDAESQLFSKAPHEYREAVQSAVEGSGLSFQSVQTKLLKLSGVSGISYPPENSFCHKAVRDTGDYIAVKRICYQQAVILITSMNRAIERTIAQFYTPSKGDNFIKLMTNEMDNVQGGKKDEPTPNIGIASSESQKP